MNGKKLPIDLEHIQRTCSTKTELQNSRCTIQLLPHLDPTIVTKFYIPKQPSWYRFTILLSKNDSTSPGRCRHILPGLITSAFAGILLDDQHDDDNDHAVVSFNTSFAVNSMSCTISIFQFDGIQARVVHDQYGSRYAQQYCEIRCNLCDVSFLRVRLAEEYLEMNMVGPVNSTPLFSFLHRWTPMYGTWNQQGGDEGEHHRALKQDVRRVIQIEQRSVIDFFVENSSSHFVSLLLAYRKTITGIRIHVCFPGPMWPTPSMVKNPYHPALAGPRIRQTSRPAAKTTFWGASIPLLVSHSLPRQSPRLLAIPPPTQT